MWRRTDLHKNGDTQRQSARAADARDGVAQTEPCAAIGGAARGAGHGAGAAAGHDGAAQTGVMDTDLQKLAVACNKAADHYCANPTHAGPDAVIDIYRAMAALASMLDAQLRQQPMPVSFQKNLH